MAISTKKAKSNKTTLEIQREQEFNDFWLEYVLKSDNHDLYVSGDGYSKGSYFFAPKSKSEVVK